MSDVKVPCVPWYEVMWFMDHDGIIQDMFTEDFTTSEEALKYYEDHKNDPGKYGWKVTKRGRGFKILKNYIKQKPCQ